MKTGSIDRSIERANDSKGEKAWLGEERERERERIKKIDKGKNGKDQ